MTTTRRQSQRVSKGGDIRQDRSYQLVAQLRWELCQGAESPVARVAHLAALLAWQQFAVRGPAALTYRFEHPLTAVWAHKVMRSPHTQVVVDGNGSGTGILRVGNPQTQLGRYGFRDHRWVFAPGTVAAWGVVRGALHARAGFSRKGLTVECPSQGLLLQLMAALGRLGINSFAVSHESLNLTIPAGDIAWVAERLALPSTAAAFAQARGA
ncbi:hypothetical protein [Mycobacteroides abscessus]|uniref:hypothetical protein n=1 Tax=Mycobacteroides abscessus TaxID=36809 RepID=UPI0009A708B2|nr:hypothetical protein [Mycobacteroides abscessus]SKT94685.1 Uncharacterised protein [Mycobacteroides abscessus subsp. massiliense]SKU13355.1 Uncharacterised protein [Mycobacteroides abscessus subsp. massiliense]